MGEKMRATFRLLLASCFLLGGCVTMPRTSLDYKPIPVQSGQASKVNGVLLVKPLIDERAPRYYTPAGKSFLTYVPLLPYVSHTYERMDETFDTFNRVQTKSLPELASEAIAKDLKSLGIFSDVRFSKNTQEIESADYVLSGTLKDTTYEQNMSSYMLGAPGVLLWLLPIPMSNNHAKIKLSLELHNERGERIWAHEIDSTAGDFFTMYGATGPKFVSSSIIYGYGSNDIGIEPDSIYAWHAEALRIGMEKAKNSLISELAIGQ